MKRNYLITLASSLLVFCTSVSAQPDQTAKELDDLKMKVMKLEMAIQQSSASGQKPAMNMPMPGQAVPKAQGMGGMGAMGDHMQQMMGMMHMMHGPMGSSPSMASGSGGMTMPSSLPGFPGASHIYHIGAASFFVDHAALIGLTAEQQSNLNKIKERTLMTQQNTDRKVESLEEELWQLTASDKPELSKVEAKVREIEKTKADNRISFIRSVGEAAQLLTAQQIQILVGQAAPATSANGTQQPMSGLGGAQSGQGASGMGMGHM